MDCVLFRHGIAVEPDEWDGAEAERPLTEKGGKRVRQAASGLASLNLSPTHILSSPFTRARSTAKLIQTVVCPSIQIQLLNDLAVDSTPERLLNKLREYPADAVVLCVGHEPLLGRLAGLLLCGNPAGGFAMKKSGAALIHLRGDVMPGQGTLGWWLQPGQLRALRNGAGEGSNGEQ
jgi:phosphohistidine phosphatase